jgi:cholesterol oxidase
MGRHVGEGVVDEYGESFAYPGLHVVDGAVMPGPVGANPALTIAAFSDRAAQRILESWERVGPRAAPVTAAAGGLAPADPEPVADETVTRLRFTEEMKGHITLGDLPFEEAADRGEEDGTSLTFRLTIEVAEVVEFVDDPDREGSATGWVNCEQLGGQLAVERGVFNLFVPGDQPGVRRMLYRLWFADSMGNPLTLVGFKTVRDEAGLDVWPDTSTLYIRVLKGHLEPEEDTAAEVVATGILRILVVDFLQQLTTFRVDGPDGMEALSTFGRLFVGELWQVYGRRAERAVEKA